MTVPDRNIFLLKVHTHMPLQKNNVGLATGTNLNL